ncbi:RluA family pseudouridine synthase [Sandaracinobacteroides saxicola]|uniref:RluA family pseudouridine synthase n=1 Tax=Sandaracinobacteroides saxicola TaxID=2759707 RepID=A0A7G5IFM6_9SPHN|nr:RluA family pseudouridine synthase [Sandaracinobacteroides saxicola]QMW22168.1 RluA family pseudouridine synthase [Sandaracinobacteroides saxicola]
MREFVVKADDDGIRLDRWFKRHLPEVSFNQVSRWARTGQLRIDGGRADPGDRILAGQTLRLPPAEAPSVMGSRPVVKERKPLSADQIDYMESMVIHRCADAIVLNKPPGLATQGGSGTTVHVDGLLDAFADEGGARPKLVHRLDKDTSGVLLLARSARAAAFFAKQFAERETRKIYWALVMGVPDLKDAFIDLKIGKQPGSGGEKMHVDESGGQSAKSRFRRIDRAADRCALLEMQPFTGRTHQLRVHAAAIGHPIVGDGKYGGKEAFLTGGISRKLHLHARRLIIGLPDGDTLDIRAGLPEHFAESMKMLGFEPEDLPLETLKFSATKEGKKLLEGRDAKARRKERKGERRGRGSAR